MQVIEFITVTFEMYCQACLLTVAHNRMDRYVALRFRDLGAQNYKDEDINLRPELENLYTVKSQKFAEIEYTVDVEKGICSCSLGYYGQPTGEPCRHQAAVARKFKLQALNAVPMFCSEGRYLYAQIAVGDAGGPKPFYHGLQKRSKVLTHHV